MAMEQSFTQTGPDSEPAVLTVERLQAMLDHIYNLPPPPPQLHMVNGEKGEHCMLCGTHILQMYTYCDGFSRFRSLATTRSLLKI